MAAGFLVTMGTLGDRIGRRRLLLLGAAALGVVSVLAMNRLRHAYLTIASGLEPYSTSGHHDYERGLVTTYMLHKLTQARLWFHFLVNTPTIVATVDAALATVIVVLLLQVAEAPRAALVATGVWRSWRSGNAVPYSSMFCARSATPRPGSHRTGGSVIQENAYLHAV